MQFKKKDSPNSSEMNFAKFTRLNIKYLVSVLYIHAVNTFRLKGMKIDIYNIIIT